MPFSTAVNTALALVQDHRRASFIKLLLAAAGLVLGLASTGTYRSGLLSPFAFMVVIGAGMYVPHVAGHTTIFERLIGFTRERANLGFLMCIADASGYPGYVGVMLGRGLFLGQEQFLDFLIAAARDRTPTWRRPRLPCYKTVRLERSSSGQARIGTYHMLTIRGPVAGSSRRRDFCDGVSRRDLLRVGTLAAMGTSGGWMLPELLRAESLAGRARPKSVIMIYLVGGPPHQDMFDLKPDAPREFAGPWRPIRTNVTGFEICEAFPRLAGMADKLTVIRSLVGNQADHDAIQVFNGRNPKRPKPSGGWPQFGTMVSKLQGPARRESPPFVSLCYPCTHGPYNEPGPGFLGMSHSPLRPLGDTRQDMVLNGITLDRLADRRALLRSIDTLRRDVDQTGMVAGYDAFTEQALGLLTSSRLAEALDLSREDPRIVERYGMGDPKIMIDGNGAPRVPQSLLVARRLIEAGVRVVTLNYSKWDWHGGRNAEGRANNSIFVREAEDFPIFDRCVSALVEDLHRRGLADDCAVVIWGEFGRTPKISNIVGRDHWPQVNCVLMAGGGMRHGQVIGATDRIAGEAVSRPVRFGEVYATLFHHLGIDPRRTLDDLQGRPQHLVEDLAAPLPELI